MGSFGQLLSLFLWNPSTHLSLDNDQDFFFILPQPFEGDESFFKMNTQQCILLFAWSLNELWREALSDNKILSAQ